MTKAVKEIRSILLGRTRLLEDGKLTSLQPGEFVMPNGVADGATTVRFLGMAHRSVAFDTRATQKNVMKEAAKAMSDIGRGVILREQPDTVACLIRYVLTRPALLTFRYVDETPVLTVWAGRSLTGLFSLKRAIKAFIRELPDTIARSEGPAPTDPLLHQEKKKKEKKKKIGKEPAPDETAAAEMTGREEAPEEISGSGMQEEPAAEPYGIETDTAEPETADAPETEMPSGIGSEGEEPEYPAEEILLPEEAEVSEPEETDPSVADVVQESEENTAAEAEDADMPVQEPSGSVQKSPKKKRRRKKKS